jgi:hypothetical protein
LTVGRSPSDSARGEACRHSSRAADQVRSHYQSDGRRAARSRDPAHPLARPDEVISRRSGLLRCLSPVGTNLPIRHVRYTAAFRGNPDIEPTRPRAVLDPKRPITLRGMETAGWLGSNTGLIAVPGRPHVAGQFDGCKQCPAVGSLSSQSDQASARSQSPIKPRGKRPSRNACLPQINRQNQLLCE